MTAAIASAIAVALALISPGLRTLPLALWLVLIGAFGLFSCIKLYERGQFHERRARTLRNKLAELTANSGTNELLTEAQAAHARQYPHLSAIRFNYLLSGVNTGIVLLGILYLVLDLVYH